MIKIVWKNATSVLLIGLFLTFCSSCEQQQEQEKSAVRQSTDRLATEMVQSIQKPIDKAKAVQALEEQHADRLRESAADGTSGR